MTGKAEIVQLYNRTLESYGREPKDGEFDAWMNVLGYAESPDLDAALRRWANDTAIEEYTQKPRGSRMPAAVELKASIERFNRAASKKFIPCNNCMEGWIRVFEGQTYKGNRIDPLVGAVKRCNCFLEWRSQQ